MKAVLGAGLEKLQGKLGFFVAKRIGSVNQITKISIPYSISGEQPSNKQEEVREIYREAIAEWNGETEAEHAAWGDAGAPLNISGFNFLLKSMGTTFLERRDLEIVTASIEDQTTVHLTDGRKPSFVMMMSSDMFIIPTILNMVDGAFDVIGWDVEGGSPYTPFVATFLVFYL